MFILDTLDNIVFKDIRVYTVRDLLLYLMLY